MKTSIYLHPQWLKMVRRKSYICSDKRACRCAEGQRNEGHNVQFDTAQDMSGAVPLTLETPMAALCTSKFNVCVLSTPCSAA